VTAPTTMKNEAMRRSGADDCADDEKRSDEDEWRR
jgi:hypothetical protein